MLHLVGKQAYKFKLLKKWKVYDVLHVSLLENDTTKKKQIDKNATKLEFNVGNSEEYKVEAIRDSAIYVKESEDYLLGLYYLIAWKSYLKKENTWELFLAVQHLSKLIRLFHKDHPEKLTATSPIINSASPMARPTIKPTKPIKQKQGQSVNNANK